MKIVSLLIVKVTVYTAISVIKIIDKDGEIISQIKNNLNEDDVEMGLMKTCPDDLVTSPVVKIDSIQPVRLFSYFRLFSKNVKCINVVLKILSGKICKKMHF